MQDYAAPLPVDQFGESMQDFPTSKVANARYGAAAATSSVITLNDNTTTIEIAAIAGSGGGGIAIKWIAQSDTQASVVATGATANFDNVVPANWRQRFVVPKETIGVQSTVGANKRNGLYNRVAWISTTVPPASVMASEF